MKAVASLLLCLLPQSADGTLAQGLRQMQELAQAGQQAQALALSERLLGSRSSRERAAVEYVRGVIHAGANEREPAGESFQRSRADGAGELRLASIYNLGSLALEQGEEWYHKLPEISGKPNPPQPPSAAPGAAPGQPAGPDPLAEAQKSYLAARAHFVERLRAQWDDADTRADVELVQRRLKRLDEIEKQRKEEQQKQQQNKQDSKNDKPQQDKQDSQDKHDPEKPKDDPRDKDKQDPEQQPDPQDKDKQEPQKPEQPKPEDQHKPGEEPQPQPQDEQQRQLSKEELTRLLDKLQQLEEQAAKLRAQIHKARRVAVKKDW